MLEYVALAFCAAACHAAPNMTARAIPLRAIERTFLLCMVFLLEPQRGIVALQGAYLMKKAISNNVGSVKRFSRTPSHALVEERHGASQSAFYKAIIREALLKAVAPELLLPPTELGILQTLETEKRVMYAGEIAAELDKSYQLVGRRGKTLSERGLVNRDLNDQGRRTFEITPLAESSYFQEVAGDSLDVGSD